MNDYSEVSHGFYCLNESYKKNRDRLKGIFEGRFPNFFEEFESIFNSVWSSLSSNIYVFSFSVYDEKTDGLGRLSMWRAYGGRSGVAVVMNTEPFFNETDANAIHAFTLPVIYSDDIMDLFNDLVGRIEENRDFICSLEKEYIQNILTWLFCIWSVSIKHPGFSEEQEWRIVYFGTKKSEYLKEEIILRNGLPQKIFKIPLKDIPEIGLRGVEIPSLLNKIIVGPTYDNASVDIAEALIDMLKEENVEEVYSKIHLSNIPLRV